MKYRYYIVSLGENTGVIKGTNDAAAAEEYRLSPEHLLIDAEKGNWMTGDSDGPEDLDVLPL